MVYNSDKHHRRSIRLKGYDYSQAGAYFITVCTHNKACVLGEVVNGEMRLNDYGRVVEREWIKTKDIRKDVDLDVFVVMPNHFHGIILIVNDASVGATRRVAPTLCMGRPTLRGLTPNSIGAIFGQFKSTVTKNIHKIGLRDFKWQRNYYEHVIRDEKDLNETREYIITNPLKWAMDRENPNNWL